MEGCRIEGYNKQYFISKTGKVFNDKDQVLNEYTDRKGRKYVLLDNERNYINDLCIQYYTDFGLEDDSVYNIEAVKTPNGIRYKVSTLFISYRDAANFIEDCIDE